jgi:hypothetical protein
MKILSRKIGLSEDRKSDAGSEGASDKEKRTDLSIPLIYLTKATNILIIAI